MRRWRHPTSRGLWVAAHPAPSELRGCYPRSHRSWAFLQTPTRCETSQKLLPVRVSGYALNSHVQKIVFLILISCKHHGGPAAGQGPPGLLHTPPGLHAPRSFQALTTSQHCSKPMGLQASKGLQSFRCHQTCKGQTQDLCGLVWRPPASRPLTREFVAARDQNHFGAPARKNQCTLYRFGLLGWIGWRQGYASRCTGGARRGSRRPLSIGSFHCLTQYECKG